jgi:hypothetical protein
MEERNIQKEISAAFDSVNLINELNLIEEKTQEDLETISRNIEHLKIKMDDIDFTNNLTEEEFELIVSLINDK